MPFTAFLDPVSKATQRKSAPLVSGAKILTALFDPILARSLATPDSPWTSITKITEAVMPHAGSSCASANSATTCKDSPA